MIRVLVILSLVGFVAKNNIAIAEDNSTLHDGRPFRKDAQGVEIIDYVAELEQSVTYLKERVIELEQQVETSNHTIARLKEEIAVEAPRAIAEPKLFEADLDVTPGKEDKKTEVKPAIVKEAPVVSEPVAPAVEQVKKEEPVKVAKLEHQVAKTEPKEIEPVVVPVVAPEMPEIAKLEKELDQEKKAAAKIENKNKVEPKKIEAAKIEKQVPAKTSDAQVAAVKPSNNSPQLVAPAVVKPTQKRPDPVDIARVQVRNEVTTVRQLRVERDSLFKKYSESPSNYTTLKVTPAKAVSKKGNSLERLEAAINLATRERDLYQIRAELGQIKLLLRDDVALINRLSKKTQ